MYVYTWNLEMSSCFGVWTSCFGVWTLQNKGLFSNQNKGPDLGFRYIYIYNNIQTSICCLRYAKTGELCCHCIPFSPIAIVDLQMYFVTTLANIQTCPLQQIHAHDTTLINFRWVHFSNHKNIPTQDTSYTNNRGFQATKKRGANTGYSFPWPHLSSSPGSPVPLTRQGTTSRTGGGPLISSDNSWPEKCGKFEKDTTYLVAS